MMPSLPPAHNIRVYTMRKNFLMAFQHEEVLDRRQLLEYQQCHPMTFYQRMIRMEEDGLVLVHRSARTTRSHHAQTFTIEITTAGRRMLNAMLHGEEREREIAAMLGKLKQPCGVATKKCYMAAKCYLRDRCSAAVIQ